MKQLITNYTFGSAAKTITLNDIRFKDSGIVANRILLIFDQTVGKTLYLYNNPSLGATISTNVITLTGTFTGLNDTDVLIIYYDHKYNSDIISVRNKPLNYIDAIIQENYPNAITLVDSIFDYRSHQDYSYDRGGISLSTEMAAHGELSLEIRSDPLTYYQGWGRTNVVFPVTTKHVLVGAYLGFHADYQYFPKAIYFGVDTNPGSTRNWMMFRYLYCSSGTTQQFQFQVCKNVGGSTTDSDYVTVSTFVYPFNEPGKTHPMPIVFDIDYANQQYFKLYTPDSPGGIDLTSLAKPYTAGGNVIPFQNGGNQMFLIENRSDQTAEASMYVLNPRVAITLT